MYVIYFYKIHAAYKLQYSSLSRNFKVQLNVVFQIISKFQHMFQMVVSLYSVVRFHAEIIYELLHFHSVTLCEALMDCRSHTGLYYYPYDSWNLLVCIKPCCTLVHAEDIRSPHVAIRCSCCILVSVKLRVMIFRVKQVGERVANLRLHAPILTRYNLTHTQLEINVNYQLFAS